MNQPPPSGPPSQWGPPPPDPGYGQPPYGQPGYGQPGYGAPNPAPRYDFAPKPGCIPLRPLGVGDIIGGSFEAFRRNPRLMLGLSAVPAFLQAAATAVAQLTVLNHRGALVDNSDPNHPVFHTGQIFRTEGGVFLSSLLALVFGAILSGLLTVVIAEDVVGRRITADKVWARIRPRLGALIWISLITSVVPVVALVVIVPGIWLWGIWAVAVPAFVIERIGVGAALGRSTGLVGGFFWRTWGIRALIAIIAQVAAAIIAIPFSAVAVAVAGTQSGSVFSLDSNNGLHLSTAFVLISAIGSFVGALISAPLRAGGDVLLYVDLRMRKERLDIALQQAASQR